MTVEDLNNYKVFKKIISSASYEIKGDAVIKAAVLFKWFDDFGAKIEGAIERPKAPKGNKVNAN